MSLIRLRPRRKEESKEFTIKSYIALGAFVVMIIAAVALWIGQHL